MINDRLIDPDSLVIEPGKVSVDVRIPWYRAIPASCIHDVTVRVDGQTVPAESLSCELNGRQRRLDEFPDLVDESWFTTDPLTVRGDLDVAGRPPRRLREPEAVHPLHRHRARRADDR